MFAGVTDFDQIPRKGVTTIEATAMLRRFYPDVRQWTCLMAEVMESQVGLTGLLDHGRSGQAGEWRWQFQDSDYLGPVYWDGTVEGERKASRWVGVVAVSGPGGASFLLCSFLDASGAVGRFYYASTGDLEVLGRFCKAIHESLRPADVVTFRSYHPALEVSIPRVADEHMVIDPRVVDDIDRQTDGFLHDQEAFRRLRIPRRRGFLFVGPPGTGKTMMVRRLARRCAAAGVSLWTVAQRPDTDDDDIGRLFQLASKAAPAFVLMEELDSLCTQPRISKAGLLNQLDGLSSLDGVLTVATTNNPELIDPALLHRPSRFDRVWKFPVPDAHLRRAFLEWAFPGIGLDCLCDATAGSEGWSYAYLNELRVTASLLTVDRGATAPQEPEIREAVKILAVQFKSGQKKHAEGHDDRSVGFQAA